MNITYNNIEGAGNLITFNDIPNILKVSDESGGTYATISFFFNIPLQSYLLLEDGLWYITIMGETITNVTDPSRAINKNFYIAPTNESTNASIVRALRNCPTIAANFNVDFSGSTVTLTAKAAGSLVNESSFTTNISSVVCIVTITDGTSFSDLYGSQISVDVLSDGEYVTTLQKNFYNGEAAFNVTPVLNTFTEIGKAKPYTLSISSIKDGIYSKIGTIVTNYAAQGYMVNQGQKYLDNTYWQYAMNFSRGQSRSPIMNNTILYVYQPTIPISFYRGNEGGGNITITYRDSAYNSVYVQELTWENTYSSIKLIDKELQLIENIMRTCFYIDVAFGDDTIRFNVIKPVQMTEYCQRILWRNSYGGISFVDLTGQKSETRELNLQTYQKNIFDYYTDPVNELEKVYDNDIEYQVTLKSHLFEEDGKWVYNDLIQSPQVWTEINGQNYAIILESVSVEETDNNNIYQATVKYRYSQEPSLI
jgi:hypothetical protein